MGFIVLSVFALQKGNDELLKNQSEGLVT